MATRGEVTYVNVTRGFGFASRPDGIDVFFHVSDLGDGLEMDEQLKGRRIEFDVESTIKGPQARRVRADR